ncbi:MAG: tetratricopeptide repeat protein, partial [Gemmatimonadota bacterium]|nr:tetratricopeptide repeat protein [Gemmatimonadota bacterium]
TKLRERIGESLGSIREGEPLARVTTANLEALELYSRGYREPRSRDALPYYEQAVALDSGFAMAWNSIAVVLRNQMSERARALEARTKAFAARDRLTGRERHLTSAMYYMDVEDDLQRAAAEYEAMLELDPNDPTAMNNVGLIYGELGDNESAERYYRDFIALNPDEFAPGYWNLVQTQIQLGKWDDAWMTIDTVTARFADPDDPSDDPATYLRTLVAANQGDLDGAIGILTDMIEQVPRGAGARLWGDLGAMYGARGRLSDARDAMSTASGITRNRLPSEYWEDAIQRAWLELLATGQQAPTIAVLDEAESTVAFLSLEVLDRPYGPLAELLARAGQVDRARDLLAEADSLIAPEHKSISFIKREMLRAEGEVALAEGRFDEAISAFRRSDRGECRICALRGLAAAYEATGQADSAIAVYTRYVDTPFPDRYASYSYALGPALAPTLERLGQMHDERGDRQEAATYFARFVEIWADSDSELQPRVNAAQGRLEEILREIG